MHRISAHRNVAKKLVLSGKYGITDTFCYYTRAVNIGLRTWKEIARNKCAKGNTKHCATRCPARVWRLKKINSNNYHELEDCAEHLDLWNLID